MSDLGKKHEEVIHKAQDIEIANKYLKVHSNKCNHKGKEEVAMK